MLLPDCYSLAAEPDDQPTTVTTEPGGAWVVAVSVVIVVILVAVLFGVIVRKRAHGTTWFPEGFCVFGRAAAFDQRPRYTGL